MQTILTRLLPAATTVALLAVALAVPVASADAQVRKPAIPPKTTPVVPPRPAVEAPSLTAQGQPVLARVSGTVFDSLAYAPMPGTTVQFVSAKDPSKVRATVADSSGVYVLDSLPVGMYLVGLIHPQVDRLGLDGMALTVNVAEGGEVELPLGLPSPDVYRATICRDQGQGSGDGMFVGMIRSARGRSLEGTARVRVQYTETTVNAGMMERRRPLKTVEASPTGAFALCGLPPGALLTTRAYSGPDSSGVVELEVPTSGLLIRDMFVGAAERVVARGASGSTTLLRGEGRLRGVVRDSAGRPLVGARVSMPGNGAEGAAAGGGQFQLDSLPGGTWMLEARAVGFQPRRVAVDVVGDEISMADVSLEAVAPVVDTVRVRSDRLSAQMAGFEQRRKLGFGHFFDESFLDKRNARTIADVLRQAPGVSINPGSNNRDQVTMRGTSGSGKCIPALFVDGVNTHAVDGVIDNVVNQADVRAIEVYTGTGSTPIEFQTRNGCGSVVIWTGARRRP